MHLQVSASDSSKSDTSERDLTDDPDSNIQSPPVVQTKQPIKSDEKTGLTPKLVQVLINKRDYLRLQVKSFQKSFPGFRFSRFSKEKPVLIDENVDVPKPCDAVASNTDCLESSFDGGHVMAVLRGEGHSDNQVAPSTSGSAMATSEKNAVATSLEKLVTSLQKKGSDVQTATDKPDWSHPEGTAPAQTELSNGHKEEHSCEDDLPLGSEANNLTKNTESCSGVKWPPVVDRRLKDLKGSHGFTSFNSDSSIQTSGSNCSATSLDALLQDRRVDPVQVLVNLGFGYSPESCHMMMRVPDRFLLQPSHAAGIDLVLAHHPELQRFVARTTATPAGAWRSVSKTLTSALAGVKTLTEMRGKSFQKNACDIPFEAEETISILHPDNQRELALRGFYSKCPTTNKTEQTPAAVIDETDETPTAASDAAAKRQLFSKTHIKQSWSLVESPDAKKDQTVDEQTDRRSTGVNWTSVSTDDSKGKTHYLSYSTSMDSSNISTVPSETHSVTISEVFKQFDEEIRKSDAAASRVGSERRRQVDGLMTSAIDDSEYEVTSVTSAQSIPVIESSPVITYKPDDTAERKHKHHVTIVVHDDPDCRNDFSEPPVNKVTTQFQAKVAGTQALLTIVNTAMDRLSDSGSDYTVVGTESQHPSLDTPENSITRSDTVFSEPSGEELAPWAPGEEEMAPWASGEEGLAPWAPGEEGLAPWAPGEEGLAPLAPGEEGLEDEENSYTDLTDLNVKMVDENENHPSMAQEIQEAEMLIQKKVKSAESDLTRMGSVQSDSSGFGDADVSADTNTAELTLHTQVVCLGSKLESTGMLSSIETTPSHQAEHDSDIIEPKTKTAGEMLRPPAELPTENLTLDKPMSVCRQEVSPVSSVNNSQTFISWCFIPPLHSTDGNNRVTREENVNKSKSKFSSFSDRSEHDVVDTSFNFPNSPLHPRELHVPSGYGKLPPLSTGRHSGRPAPGFSDDNLSGDDQIRSPASSVFWHSSPGGGCPQYQGGGARHVSYPLKSDSKTSLTEESDYSSVADSTVSCSNVDLLDYRKLVRLINQPSRSGEGRRRSIAKYRPKKPIRDWTTLVRRKRIEEETRLLQHAVHKYKSEMCLCEAMFSLRYQAAFDDLSHDEREELEAVQYLWSEIRQQILKTEQLLTARMKGVDAGNDFFTYLSSLNVLERMIELLKEQMYHQEVSSQQDDDDDERTHGHTDDATPSWWSEHPSHSWRSPPPQAWNWLSSSSWGPQSSPWCSPLTGGNELAQKKLIQKSMEELRGSLIEEIRQEMSRSTQQLNLDMQARDNEIHRLRLELLMRDVGTSRRKPRVSRPHVLRPSRQTIV